MKRTLLCVLVIIVVLFIPNQSWAQCPEDTMDLGICDTLYVETFNCDHKYVAPPGSFDSVRVAVYVTHDSNTFWDGEMWVQDSIRGFGIPLTFWHQPPGCADSVIFPFGNPEHPDSWNNLLINPYAPMNRSMFRHIVDEHTGDTTYNRLLQMVENWNGAWTVYTDFESHSSDGDSGRCSFSCIPMLSECQRWWEGSRVLLATLTFHVYMSDDCDTTEIGLDSTYWLAVSHLVFWRNDMVGYFPRHFLPVKDTIYRYPYPYIISITDVGNDQGRQVRLNWARAFYDAPGSPVTITEYSIWRRIDEDKGHDQSKEILSSNFGMLDGGRLYPPGDWDFIKTVPARGEEEYNTVCPTLGDSTQADSMYWSVFFVSAMTPDPLVYYDSEPDSGYSLDNIPPIEVKNLDIPRKSGQTLVLMWMVPGEYPGEQPATAYDIRYSTSAPSADTATWWDAAIQCEGEPYPASAGQVDSFMVTLDLTQTYYFAIKLLDDRPNYSEISNIVKFTCGDATGDGIVNIADVVYLVNYLFAGGDPPYPMAVGDATCDGVVNIADVVYLVNYLFAGGDPPCSP